MRISGAILLMILGTTATFAQGDMRADYGPVKEAPAAAPEKPAPAADTAKKPESKPEAKPKP